MRFSHFRILPAIVLGAAICLACGPDGSVFPTEDAEAISDPTMNDGIDPGQDATPDTISSPEDESMVPQDAATDADSRDATTDADSRDATTDADSRDAATDADSRDATTDADSRDATTDADSRDGSVYPGDAGIDAAKEAGVQGPPPSPLFAPGESGAVYTFRSVCGVGRRDRVGTADMCCRTSSIRVETTCDTVMREEPDGTGNFRVVIDSLQNCTRTPTPTGYCSRSGNLTRCDRTNLVCPPNQPESSLEKFGAGTYERRTWVNPLSGKRSALDHYWVPGCPMGAAGFVPTAPFAPEPSTCAPTVSDYSITLSILSTLERTGPGTFSLQRTWNDPSTKNPRGTHPSCTDERFSDVPLALKNRYVTTGRGTGGTFHTDRYECTYTLTKK